MERESEKKRTTAHSPSAIDFGVRALPIAQHSYISCTPLIPLMIVKLALGMHKVDDPKIFSDCNQIEGYEKFAVRSGGMYSKASNISISPYFPPLFLFIK